MYSEEWEELGEQMRRAWEVELDRIMHDNPVPRIPARHSSGGFWPNDPRFWQRTLAEPTPDSPPPACLEMTGCRNDARQ